MSTAKKMGREPHTNVKQVKLLTADLMMQVRRFPWGEAESNVTSRSERRARRKSILSRRSQNEEVLLTVLVWQRVIYNAFSKFKAEEEDSSTMSPPSGYTRTAPGFGSPKPWALLNQSVPLQPWRNMCHARLSIRCKRLLVLALPSFAALNPLNGTLSADHDGTA